MLTFNTDSYIFAPELKYFINCNKENTMTEQEEIRFWKSFGYTLESLIYCVMRQELPKIISNVKGMASYE